MAQFRITFTDGPTGNRSKTYDVDAQNSDEAFKIAYAKPESKSRWYSDVSVMEIEPGPKQIGVEFESYDTVFKQSFRGYLFFTAEDEADAIRQYNEKYKGKRYWFDACKPAADGKNEYRRVISTYYC